MSERDSESLFARTAKWLENYWANASSLIGSLSLAIAGILPSVEAGNGLDWLLSTTYGKFFSAGAFLSLVGGIVSIIITPGYREQQERIQLLERQLQIEKINLENALSQRKKGYSRLLNDELKVLFRIIKFGDTERISLYRYDPLEQIFFMIARYSSNLILRKPGRVLYPVDQGCLGRAWTSGSAFVDNLPDPETPQYYEVLRTDWNMSQDMVDSMSLKCRTIGALAVNNLQMERFALLVFESTKTKGFKENLIRNAVNESGEDIRITLLLERVGKIEPNLVVAYEEGF